MTKKQEKKTTKGTKSSTKTVVKPTKIVVEPVETIVKEPEFRPSSQLKEKCQICNSQLVKLLFDSRAAVPKYAAVCNNQECSFYRKVISWL